MPMLHSLSMSDDNNNQQPLPLLPDLCTPASLLGLVLIGEALALVLVLADTRSALSWSKLGVVSMSLQWIVLIDAFCLCRLRPLLNRLPPITSGCLALFICLTVAGAILTLSHWLYLHPMDPGNLGRSFLIAALFTAILLRYLYLQQQLVNQQKAELQARIQSLQARIRPHFLFNSMNTIASLIPVDPHAAEETLEDLSDLFRASLQKPGLVNVEDEVNLCKRYIAVEQRRLGDRLTMQWHYDTPLPEVKIPSLILQPLLENAICHGIQRLPKGGEIKVEIQASDSLEVIIINPIPTLPSSATDRGNKIALDNIRHRLELYFSKGAELTIDRLIDESLFKVKLTFPMTIEQNK